MLTGLITQCRAAQLELLDKVVSMVYRAEEDYIQATLLSSAKLPSQNIPSSSLVAIQEIKKIIKLCEDMSGVIANDDAVERFLNSLTKSNLNQQEMESDGKLAVETGTTEHNRAEEEELRKENDALRHTIAELRGKNAEVRNLLYFSKACQ